MPRRAGTGSNGKLQATVFKKCDRSAHSPETNKGCAARDRGEAKGKCQHTCEPGEIERCHHAWTVRYNVNGVQRDQSFKDELDAHRRIVRGSGLRKAQDFQLELTRGKRAQGRTYVDPKAGNAPFGEAAETYIGNQPVAERTRELLRGVWRNHVKPVFGNKTLAQAALMRTELETLLARRMGGMSANQRDIARRIVAGTLDAAVKTRKLAGHTCDGIQIARGGKGPRTDFVFPRFDQVKFLADGGTAGDGRHYAGAGIAVWLMRGCGLRIGEALAVEKADFIHRGRTLRCARQASRDGRESLPLKHREEGGYRDVPVPAWLWEMVKDMPGGPLTPGNAGRRCQVYSTAYGKFTKAAKAIGIEKGFSPHSLRHAFASALLGRNTPIGDVAEWLGHRDINKTYAIYRHMLPEAPRTARDTLDAEYAEWRQAGQQATLPKAA
jgi:integrase